MIESSLSLPQARIAAPGASQGVKQILEQIRQVVANDQILELRALAVQGRGRPHTEAGFFDYDHLPEFAQAAWHVNNVAKGVYFTLNPLRPEILARRRNRIAWAQEGELAKNADVASRRWLLIDIDPVRDSHISASDAEKHEALQIAGAVKSDLQIRGWPAPYFVDSGNGYHLLYAVDLPAADDEGRVEEVLKALAQRFDNPRAKVDQGVFNPARICKIPGTLARKGDELPDRPHRRSGILEAPQSREVVPVGLLDELARECQKSVVISAPPPQSRRPSNMHEGPSGPRLRIDAWLNDLGVPFRVKNTPDDKGRTCYVLGSCPFDSSHHDPDSCIMQDTAGKLYAKCFHNSCSGRGWKEFKEALGAPKARHYDLPAGSNVGYSNGSQLPSDPTDETHSSGEFPPDEIGWPVIQANHRQLRDVTEDALNAIRQHNQPPYLFQRGDALTRLRTDPDRQTVRIEALCNHGLRGVLARCANWTKQVVREHRIDVYQDLPPMEVARDLAALAHWEGIPILRGLVSCPIFAANGQLVHTPGYHPASHLYFRPSANFTMPAISLHPSDAEIRRAREFLLDEFLGDFPFADEASRAAAICVLLMPFVRYLIDGPMPLILFDAPTEGTGKTLLAIALSFMSLGHEPKTTPEAHTDEEWRKRILAILIDSADFALLDNLNRVLDSGALASVLTARVWTDRLLGVSKNITLPNDTIWLATGNNTQLSAELLRRVVICRLDAKTDSPCERTAFRHPFLMRWVKERRGDLVAAALTLCQAWIDRGRPAGNVTLGMFESWAQTLSGILEVAGVPGLLANAREFRLQRSSRSDEWRSFVAVWKEKLGNAIVGAAQLLQLATDEQLLDSVLGDKKDRGQRVALGRALTKIVDRTFGEVRVERAGTDRKNSQLYRLVSTETSAVVGCGSVKGEENLQRDEYF